MPHEATKLVLGRGEVYFDRFITGTRIGEGERYLGNTTSFRIQREVQTVSRATSWRGRRIDTPPAVLSESHSVDCVTDNVDLENVAMWFGSETVVPAAFNANVVETFVVQRGRYYQLGKSQNVAGTRNVIDVTVRIGSTVVAPSGNYTVNLALGRIEIAKYAPAIASGATISVTFTVRESDTAQVGAQAAQVYGALRFVSFNETPNNRKPQIDYYFPFVSIMPRGQVDMKGDEFQQWGFEATAYNLNPATRQLYPTRAPEALITAADQEAIIDELGSLGEFPLWEDLLHVATNVDWPPALEFEEL